MARSSRPAPPSSIRESATCATTSAPLVALRARDGVLARPTAWVFGNEARGLSDEHFAAVDLAITVPIYGRAESMNLATAASVCLYESAFAQRS